MKIEIQHISKWYTTQTTRHAVIDNISATFTRNTSYAITGVSGTGKSTLLHILAGLDEPSTGSVLYDNTCISSLNVSQKNEILSTKIGLVFQQPYLIHALSVLENVIIKYHMMDISSESAVAKGIELLDIVGLAHKAHAYPPTLSGGQQQRVAVLRALFCEPKFLLADEPTGCLDEKSGKTLVDFLVDCQKEWKMGMIISSHDPYIAQSLNHTYRLHNGKLEKKS